MDEKNDTPTPIHGEGNDKVIDQVACDMVIAAFQYLSDLIRKFAEEHKDELNKMIREEMAKKGPSNE
jgi:hypothetical protein